MLSIDVSISKKTTWGYDTDVLIMRVVHQAVTTSAVSAIDRILAKHNTRMMSSVSYDPGFCVNSCFLLQNYSYLLVCDTECHNKIPYHAKWCSEILWNKRLCPIDRRVNSQCTVRACSTKV